MSYFQQHNWQKWLFLGLVILNIITLSIVWSENGPPIPKLGNASENQVDKRRQADEFLLRQLGYDEKQRQAFFELTSEHVTKMQHIHDQLRTHKKQFFDLLGQEQVDSAKVHHLSVQIADWQVKMEQATYYHFKAIRAIGTPDQQKKFDEIIFETLKMIGNPSRERVKNGKLP
ncbi:MAG: Spy/CpxP family protein refolding chaperone [Flammeovirgaceae bacterium]